MAINNFKNVERGKSSDESDVEELLSELDQLIPGFVGSHIFERDIYSESDEDHYTTTLVKYFENEYKESRFSFKQEKSLPNRRRIDIAVHLKANSEYYIFNIEAKFLPPTDYVSEKNTSAIKRFKCGQHGLSNRNPYKAKLLPENAIVAYSKSGTFDEHLVKINNKISKLATKAISGKFGLTWQKSEQLQKIYINTTAKFKSTHPRVDGSMVALHHFWVYV